MHRRSNNNSNAGSRVSVRGQRRIQSNAPPAPPARKRQQENAQQNSVIGVSAVPLSSRFSGLTKEFDAKPQKKQQQPFKQVAVANGKRQQQQQQQVRVTLPKKKIMPVLGQTKKQKLKQYETQQKQQKQQQQKQKLAQVAQANRVKRQHVVDKHRKGLEQVAPAPKNAKQAKQKKQQPKAQAKQPQHVASGGRGGRGRGRGGAVGGRGGAVGGRGGRGGRGDSDKKDLTGDDLDVEMDSYWFDAGKGPDPKAAQLDRQMEQYWADKPQDDTFAAAVTSDDAAAKEAADL